MKPRGGAAKFAALIAYIIVILVAAPQAQQPVAFSGSPGAIVAGPPAAPADATDIDLLVGRSTVLNVGSSIARVSLTVPDVADAMVTSPQQLLIHGKQPGTISLFVWDHAGGIKKYEVNVRRDLSELSAQIKQLFPGEPITITGSGKDVVISGTVSSKYVVDKAADVAGGYVEKKENVVNLLKQQEGLASNQVMLRVRFAEVSRSALQELGASFFTGPGGFHDYVAQASTQQFPTIKYDELSRGSIQGEDHWGGGRDTVTDTGGKMTFSDMLNFMIFNNRYNIGTLIKALQDKGLFQSLAEPNLIALNGKEASFLAGGEYPYPVVQPSGNGQSITIEFKEFGIRLNFTPTVLANDLINLKVKPEVSSLDFSNAIILDGFRIPALSTRRTETEVELQNGQTFAIAGLLNNSVQSTMRKIPGIGDIPILGWLFKSRAMQKNQTELVVMITPQIVRMGSTGVSEGLPSPVEPWLDAPKRRLPPSAPYVGSPKYPATETNGGNGDAPAPAPAADPATSTPAPAPSSSSTTPAPAAMKPAPVAARPSKPAPKPVEMSAAKPTSAKPAMATSTTTSVAVPATSKSDAASSVMAVADAAAPSAPAASAAAPPATPVTRPMSKEELKAIEEAREREREAAAKAAEKAEKARVEREKREAEERKIAEEKAEKERKIAEEKAEKERERQEKIEKERAKKQAEIDKKNAEIAQRRAAEQEKREKALAEAAARLREAQAAYQAQLKAASKGGTNDQQTKK